MFKTLRSCIRAAEFDRRLCSYASLISNRLCKLVAYVGAEFKFNIACRIYRLRLVRLASDLRVASCARTVSSDLIAQALNFADRHGAQMFENFHLYAYAKSYVALLATVAEQIRHLHGYVFAKI